MLESPKAAAAAASTDDVTERMSSNPAWVLAVALIVITVHAQDLGYSFFISLTYYCFCIDDFL